MWPGINALNVWDLPYDMWQLHALAAQEWEKQNPRGNGGY